MRVLDTPGRDRVNIFLAEDNPGDVVLVQEALSEQDIPHTLYTIADGDEALRFVSNMGLPGHPPCAEIVLLDINLPKVSGLRLLKELRRNPQKKRIPVIIVSSSESPEEKREMAEIGDVHYFKKTADLDEFMGIGALIRQLLTASMDCSSS